MRGYGRSSVYTHARRRIAQQHIVGDMLALIDSLGRERAVWVGHDWGSPVVWNIASHHPERCAAVGNLCVPYYTLERGLDPCARTRSIGTSIQPTSIRQGSGNTSCTTRKTSPARRRRWIRIRTTWQSCCSARAIPAASASRRAPRWSRINRGWFGGGEIPSVPRDDDVVTEADVCAYASALARNGFFGPNSYYMNHDANAAYAAARSATAVISTCRCCSSRRSTTTRASASRRDWPSRCASIAAGLTEGVVYSGHWMAQEKPLDVNAALARWLATSVAETWPKPRAGASQ